MNKQPDATKTRKRISNDVTPEMYRVLMEHAPICTIDILFFNPEKTHTLLGKRTNEPYKGTFYAFGGRLRKHESFEEAATRVAKQETGIELLPDDITFGGVLNEMNDGSVFTGIDYHAVDLYFACTVPLGTKIKLDSQHSEYRWFEVNDRNLYPNIKTRIENSLKALG